MYHTEAHIDIGCTGDRDVQGVHPPSSAVRAGSARGSPRDQLRLDPPFFPKIRRQVGVDLPQSSERRAKRAGSVGEEKQSGNRGAGQGDESASDIGCSNAHEAGNG